MKQKHHSLPYTHCMHCGSKVPRGKALHFKDSAGRAIVVCDEKCKAGYERWRMAFELHRGRPGPPDAADYAEADRQLAVAS